MKDDKTGRLNGVEVEDQVSKKKFVVKGSCVVNCTGTFADAIR